MITLLIGCATDEADPTPAPFSFPPAPASNGLWWQPEVGLDWQWQITEPPIDLSFDVGMYDIDLFDVESETVAQLQARGIKVVCYVSVGSWENWREDVGEFPDSVIGKEYVGWAGERWLDIRQIDLLAPIMTARFDLCKEKGFDGIEPDNIDAYTNDTGFPLTYDDQLRYNIWLAEQAHQRGLSIGLKNNPEQASELEPYFDWALTEECFVDEWCEDMEPFITAGKPVFAAEYIETIDEDDFLSDVCPAEEELGFRFILKDLGLDAWRVACP
jgi:hypothetical protein